jgi:hypothetical protein
MFMSCSCVELRRDLIAPRGSSAGAKRRFRFVVASALSHYDRAMRTPRFLPLVLLVGFMAVPLTTLAQAAGGGLPSSELIQRADSFQPPRLADYAARLVFVITSDGVAHGADPKDLGLDLAALRP